MPSIPNNSYDTSHNVHHLQVHRLIHPETYNYLASKMPSLPIPSTAPEAPSNSENPPHPAHSIYPIFVPTHLSDNFIHAFSGATAGFASGVVTCPLDVIKTKLQAQGGWSIRHGRAGTTSGAVLYRGLFGTASTIWRDEGFRGMYRGLGPLILGYLPTWTVYFTVYEKAKGVLEPGEQIPVFRLFYPAGIL